MANTRLRPKTDRTTQGYEAEQILANAVRHLGMRGEGPRSDGDWGKEISIGDSYAMYSPKDKAIVLDVDVNVSRYRDPCTLSEAAEKARHLLEPAMRGAFAATDALLGFHFPVRRTMSVTLTSKVADVVK